MRKDIDFGVIHVLSILKVYTAVHKSERSRALYLFQL